MMENEILERIDVEMIVVFNVVDVEDFMYELFGIEGICFERKRV